MKYVLDYTPYQTACTFKADMLRVYISELNKAVEGQLTAKTLREQKIFVGRAQAYREMINFLEELQIEQ